MLAAMDTISVLIAAAMNFPITEIKYKRPLYHLIRAFCQPPKGLELGKELCERFSQQKAMNIHLFLCLSTKEQRE